MPRPDAFPGIRFDDHMAAFEAALVSGRLTHAPGPRHVGDFMYMGTKVATGLALFKHALTREYLPG